MHKLAAHVSLYFSYLQYQRANFPHPLSDRAGQWWGTLYTNCISACQQKSLFFFGDGNLQRKLSFRDRLFTLTCRSMSTIFFIFFFSANPANQIFTSENSSALLCISARRRVWGGGFYTEALQPVNNQFSFFCFCWNVFEIQKLGNKKALLIEERQKQKNLLETFAFGRLPPTVWPVHRPRRRGGFYPCPLSGSTAFFVFFWCQIKNHHFQPFIFSKNIISQGKYLCFRAYQSDD